jgi:hypothetical protein
MVAVAWINEPESEVFSRDRIAHTATEKLLPPIESLKPHTPRIE